MWNSLNITSGEPATLARDESPATSLFGQKGALFRAYCLGPILRSASNTILGPTLGPWKMFNVHVLQQVQRHPGSKSLLRVILFVYLGLVLCPIQYCELAADVDNTWLFGLNYAAAHHLTMGRDIVWTWGSLGYLQFPQDINNNLARGLVCQATLWVAVLAILWDVVFWSGYPLKNLAFFTLFLGLSGASPGAADVLLTAALILLAQYQLRGGVGRYLAALTMLGLLPLIQFLGAVMVVGVVAGLVVNRIMQNRPGGLRDAALATLVPTLVAGTAYWLTVGSFHTWAGYLRSSLELSSGFNLAMSTWGPPTDLLAALETLVLLAIALARLKAQNRGTAMFFIPVLAIPILVSFKHGFVRQDAHVAHFFCFVAIALGFCALATSLNERRTITTLTVVALLFTIIWQGTVARTGPRLAFGVTGIRTPFTIWNAIRFKHLRQALNARAQQNFASDLGIEPEIKAIVRDQPVASLSESYSNAYLDGLNLVLYPVIQRYSAYTPYLDELNASWIRDKGPRFLIFDGKSIDGRHPWTETPAMWLETYRWYDTRLLGPHNLLLERRTEPRFTHFEPVARSHLRFGEELQFPPSSPVFWTMQCSVSATGKLRALLFRVLEVTMTVDKKDGRSDAFRVLLAVVGAPSPGNYLPSNLPEFAAVFSGSEIRGFAVEKLKFGGPGASAYAPGCVVELLRPVR